MSAYDGRLRVGTRLLYVVAAGGHLKIGWSSDPSKRAVTFRGVLLGATPGTYEDEKALHRQFRPYRLGREREWYLDVPAIRDLAAGWTEPWEPVALPVKTDGDVLGLAGAATLLGVDVFTVRRWANAGRLPCTRSQPRGGQRRFLRSDVDALAREIKATA